MLYWQHDTCCIEIVLIRVTLPGKWHRQWQTDSAVALLEMTRLHTAAYGIHDLWVQWVARHLQLKISVHINFHTKCLIHMQQRTTTLAASYSFAVIANALLCQNTPLLFCLFAVLYLSRSSNGDAGSELRGIYSACVCAGCMEVMLHLCSGRSLSMLCACSNRASLGCCATKGFCVTSSCNSSWHGPYWLTYYGFTTVFDGC